MHPEESFLPFNVVAEAVADYRCVEWSRRCGHGLEAGWRASDPGTEVGNGSRKMRLMGQGVCRGRVRCQVAAMGDDTTTTLVFCQILLHVSYPLALNV